MSDVLLVITNLPDAQAAGQLARRLIEERAAACVNQLAPCTSTYRWQGNIETATEVPLLIKTTRAAYPRLEQLIRAAHPYELPEIIAVPVKTGLPAYLDWVTRETDRHGKETVSENETCHARPPHPNPPPEGEGANESLREFHTNALKE